jgi:excinuclease ABC subunit B
MNPFKVVADYQPMGDQPEAIESLTRGIRDRLKHQTLLGVTGSGKTYTMAKVIEQVQMPTLVIAHNKTLAAQLCSEFKDFFPNNAVEYFVSYYDYYQPEAYVAHRDMYIEKDSSINDEIDKLRHSATAALFERRDVLIVASVSCIYGLGNPEDYQDLMVSLRAGTEYNRDKVMRKLIDIQYQRNDISFTRGTFRVRGDVLEIFPASSSENAQRVEFFGDEIERIMEINTITGEVIGTRQHLAVFPASHYATRQEKIEKAVSAIEVELAERIEWFKSRDRLLEAQRIEQRTQYDIEMLREMGFCSGIENYSRHLAGRPAGSRPFTLIDYFPKDFLLMVDESHVTLPQIRGMYGGDKSRKESLVEYGFRLPSALDNRPLSFTEFESLVNQAVFVSATPGPYEHEHSQKITEQILRPTGLIDPEIDVRPVTNQIDNLLGEINERVENKQRTLITTLTKKMAEDLTRYLADAGIKVRYLHSDIDTMERMEIIRELRLGVFDVLVGINLLREGLDLPEVSLVAILDADKEGFLRSSISLIQTIGRAARHVDGRVIMYANTITPSMEFAIKETDRRRSIQQAYNEANNITPRSIMKKVRAVIEATTAAESGETYETGSGQTGKSMPSGRSAAKLIRSLEKEMHEAARNLEFEKAAALRDEIMLIRSMQPDTRVSIEKTSAKKEV